MKLIRLEAWPERLAEAIKDARGKTFELGEFDCGYFAVACCIAVTGEDVGKRWRGTYKGKAGLARLYAALGVRDVAGWADHVIGIRRPVVMARRGDWMLSPKGEEPSLGICDGAQAVFLTPGGQIRVPTLMCTACWQIGE